MYLLRSEEDVVVPSPQLVRLFSGKVWFSPCDVSTIPPLVGNVHLFHSSGRVHLVSRKVPYHPLIRRVVPRVSTGSHPPPMDQGRSTFYYRYLVSSRNYLYD